MRNFFVVSEGNGIELIIKAYSGISVFIFLKNNEIKIATETQSTQRKENKKSHVVARRLRSLFEA